MRNISALLGAFLMTTTLASAMDTPKKELHEIYGDLLERYPSLQHTLTDDKFTDIYLDYGGDEFAIMDHFQRQMRHSSPPIPIASATASSSFSPNYGAYPGSMNSYSPVPTPSSFSSHSSSNPHFPMYHGSLGHPTVNTSSSYASSHSPTASSSAYVPTISTTSHPMMFHSSSSSSHSPFASVPNTNVLSSSSHPQSFSSASTSPSIPTTSSLFGSESKSSFSGLPGTSVIGLIYEKINGSDLPKIYSVDGEMFATTLTPDEMGMKPCNTFYKKCFEEILNDSQQKLMQLNISYSHSLAQTAEMEMLLKMMELKLESAEIKEEDETAAQAFQISINALEKAHQLFQSHLKGIGVLKAQMEELAFVNQEISEHLKTLNQYIREERS